MERSEIGIREAVAADADALIRCIDAAYSKYNSRITDMPPVSAGVAKDIATNQVWVVEGRGKILGGLFLVPDVGFIKLANLAVHPEFAGMGLGRKLMELCESEAIRQGFVTLRLNTHVKMPENIQLYLHFGWEIISQTGNTVTMEKYLKQN